jgi:arsenate reductase (thioredoxin)
MKILILCTGNSCRSQMAEGFLKSFDDTLEVYSAGTYPASKVSSKAIRVMLETGIEISNQFPKNVDKFTNQEWDYVITVCDHANETCPVFAGKVKHRIHIGFEDPSNAMGSEEHIMSEFRRIRDKIKTDLYKLYVEHIKN